MQATWFGQVDPQSGSIIPIGSVDQIVEKLTTDYPTLGEYQPDHRDLAKKCHFVENDVEYNRLLREVSLELVRRKLRSTATDEQDMLQSIEALDDLDMTINHLEERLREWSLLHEDDCAGKAEVTSPLEGRTSLDELATAIADLRKSRGKIEDALISSMATISPNLSELSGPLLAARLISRAGSLRRLSEMPSSSIQIIGAEKSLFKHLKGKAPSPKHGLIYRHPSIMNAPKHLRGRLARALAGKMAMAARIDYHSGIRFPELKDSLDNRLSEIRRKGRSKKPPRKNV